MDPDAEELCDDGPDAAAAAVDEAAKPTSAAAAFADLVRSIPPAAREALARKLRGDVQTAGAVAVPQPKPVAPDQPKRAADCASSADPHRPAQQEPAPSTNGNYRSASDVRTTPSPNGRGDRPPSGNGGNGAHQRPDVPHPQPRRAKDRDE